MDHYKSNLQKIYKIQNHFKTYQLEITCYDYRLAKIGFTYDQSGCKTLISLMVC